MKAPDTPTDLGKRSWFGTVKRVVSELPGRQPDRLGRRAHLLLGPLDLPRVHRDDLDPRPRRRPGDDHARGHRHRVPARARVGRRHRHAPDRADLGQPVDRVPGPDRRSRAGAVDGVELRRRLHARVERDLRARGGPPVLEAAAAPAARDAGARPDGGAGRARADRLRPGGRGDRQRGRAGRHRGDGLGHRQVAGAARRRDADAGDPLLVGAEREAGRLPLDLAGQRGRRGPVDRWPRPASRSTSPTSAPTTRPTARSAA